MIHSLKGAGRFVIGLAADVKILEIANILRRVGKWRVKIARKEKSDFAEFSERCIFSLVKNLGKVIRRRKIYDRFLQWKQEKNGTTALMIEDHAV